MIVVLALGAALANALTSVFQRIAVQSAPEATTLHFSLIRYALHRRIWFLGFALMIVSFVLQALALHIGRLSQVQPILTTELVFLVLVLGTWFGFTMGRREWLSSLAVSAGLAGFLYFAHPEYGMINPPTWEWALAGGACAAGIAVAIAAARRGPAWWRAAMFGTGAAISFAFTSACTKTVSDFAAHSLVSVFHHWQTYALAGFGALAVFLAQNAFHAGPIVASQSTIVLVDPLVSILIGVGIFGDNLRTNWPWGALEAFSLLVMFAGAYWLAHSPSVSGIYGSDRLVPRRAHSHGSAPGLPDSTCTQSPS